MIRAVHCCTYRITSSMRLAGVKRGLRISLLKRSQSRDCMGVCKRRFGVTHTLDEVFEADPIVKHVICDEGGVNNAYLGKPCACLISPLSAGRACSHGHMLRTHTMQSVILSKTAC